MATVQTPVPALEFGNLPINGRWVWRDETKTLEYLSNNPAADKKEAKKRHAKRSFLPHDFAAKRNDGTGTNINNRSYDEQVKNRAHGLQRTVKLRQKQREESLVSLDRAKNVAYDIMSDTEQISPPFDDLFDTPQFDVFLIYLLKYFQTFFELRAHENKPNPMNIEPSLADVRLAEDLRKQLEFARKQFGQAYIVLVLGLGLEDFHHMACGMSRVSATYTDRNMYESIYSFSTFLVWIVFRRKDYDQIKQEVGNMLRSDTFNPALRVKNYEEVDEISVTLPQVRSGEFERQTTIRGKNMDKKSNAIQPITKLKPAEYRRLHPKRPAIKNIIHQRSPAVVAILPSPKEEAAWLFSRKGAPASPVYISREKVDAAEEDARLYLLTATDKAKVRAGIIGEALSQFNKLTLTPLGTENEDEEDEGSHSAGRRGSLGKSIGDPNRQQTAVSVVTTETPFSDDEEMHED